MLGGPNLITFEFLEEMGLMDATLKNANGSPLLQDWVDWNSDLSPECMGYLANYGHPDLRRYMLAVGERLLGDFGADGIFLDGAIRWSNAPDYSPAEGVIEYANTLKARFPGKLLMAEDGYDALWGAFQLFATSWGPLGLGNSMCIPCKPNI